MSPLWISDILSSPNLYPGLPRCLRKCPGLFAIPSDLVKQIGPNVIFCLRGSHSIPHAVSAHSQLALKESSRSQSSVSLDLDQLLTASWSPYWSCPSLTRLTLRVHCAGTMTVWKNPNSEYYMWFEPHFWSAKQSPTSLSPKTWGENHRLYCCLAAPWNYCM